MSLRPSMRGSLPGSLRGSLPSPGGGEPAPGPTNTVAPAITYSEPFELGDLLTCGNGTWTTLGTISGYTKQWYRSGAAISGATGDTFEPEASDDDLSVFRCDVTATDEFGSRTANSNTVGPILFADLEVLVILGDSTIAAYLGTTAVADYLDWPRNIYSLANPGDTIANQKTAWDAFTLQAATAAVVIQVGLNDYDHTEAASVAIARYQALVDQVRADIPVGAKIYCGWLLPARSRYIDLEGGTNGPIAWQKLLDLNAAISGLGATPITSIDKAITDHFDLLSDGSDNLDAAYDTGDGIHPNNAGRLIIAEQWQDVLNGDVTAPTLSAVSGTQTGETTATLAATTNDATGRLYWFVSTSATPPTWNNLINGVGAVFASSEAITSSGAKTEPATGLTGATTYYLHVLHRDEAENRSAITTSASFATAADSTPPTLSAPSATATSTTTASLSVSTNEGNGTLYWFVSTSATVPGADLPTQITNLKAGTGATYAASEAVGSTGTKTETATGLTASTTYYMHALHSDANANDSAISTSAGTTTPATDFDPLDLSPILWLDASDATTLKDAGGANADADEAVATWNDKSGNANHATQATGANQPLRKSSIINGRDVLRFDGAGDNMQFPNPGFEVFVTWFLVTKTADSTYLTMWDPGNNNGFFEVTDTGSGATPTALGFLGDVRVNGVLVSPFTRGQLQTMRGSAVNVLTADDLYSDHTTWQILGYGSGFDAAMDVCEILIFTPLSSTDRDDVEAYLATKWGI